jgi:hypothetical protein
MGMRRWLVLAEFQATPSVYTGLLVTFYCSSSYSLRVQFTQLDIIYSSSCPLIPV